jgi:hypothetical protein
MNGKMYIIQSIAWFVSKGEPVSVDQPIVPTLELLLDKLRAMREDGAA